MTTDPDHPDVSRVPTAATVRPRILCVDDEPAVLQGIGLHLRRRFEVHVATSGAAGLAFLQESSEVAAIMSDMRMPGMDGAAFLRASREVARDATRLLLTGQTDMESAIAAVNEGQIFRFLTKPCPPATLLAAMDAAVEQHRLVTAERVLLGQTLLGSVKALTDVLALTQPLAFGRSTRLKQLVAELATAMALRERWQVEVAAMLSQLGSLALPAEVVERLYYGVAVRADDEALLKRVPETIESLLGHIPRLEVVRAILAGMHGVAVIRREGLSEAQQACAETGVALLLVAQGFDTLEAQGSSPQLAIDTLRSRKGVYRADVLEALSTIRGDLSARREVREIPVSGLRPGMVFAEDVKMDTGALFVPRGYEITPGLIERIRSLRSGALKSVVRVIVPERPRESDSASRSG